MKGLVTAVALVLAAMPALAHPPPGKVITPASAAWWSCHTQPGEARSCCSKADGHVLGDNDWRRSEDGLHYQVRIYGVWYDVPDDAILNDARECGPNPDVNESDNAVVWYVNHWSDTNTDYPVILCFIVGTMY